MSSRPDVYLDGDRWTFRASAIGGCVRGLVAARLGIHPQPPKAFLQGALQASSEAEEKVVEILTGKGWEITGQQKAIRLECPEGSITGHLDGLVNDGEPLEIKAFGRTLFEKYVKGGLAALGPPFTQMYGMQITAYGLAMGKPVNLVVFRKDDQDGNLGQYLEKRYEKLPYTEEVLCERMRYIIESAAEVANGGEWPDCDAKCSSSSWYWHIHSEKPRALVDSADIAEKMERAHQLKVTMDALDAEYKKLRHELIEAIGSGTQESDKLTATVVKSFQTRTDLDKMRREMGDEFLAQFAYESPQTRLVIRPKKGA